MKVLVIDDEPIVRRALARALVGNGHEVLESHDGRDGLEKWRSFNPDLVFLDVLMPELSGLQVLSEVRKSNKAKVILMSAHAGVYDPQDVKKVGATMFLSKPFDDIFRVVELAEKLAKEFCVEEDK